MPHRLFVEVSMIRLSLEYSAGTRGAANSSAAGLTQPGQKWNEFGKRCQDDRRLDRAPLHTANVRAYEASTSMARMPEWLWPTIGNKRRDFKV